MRRYVKPALRYSADTTSKIISQVLVAVVTALCVTFITNSMLFGRTEMAIPAVSGMAAFGDASGSQPGSALPPLEPVVVPDVPEPFSQAPAALANSLAPGGLYYAETEKLTDPLRLLEQSGT